MWGTSVGRVPFQHVLCLRTQPDLPFFCKVGRPFI